MALSLVHDSEFDLSLAHGGAANPKTKHYYGFDPAAKFLMMTPGSTHVLSVASGDPAGFSVEFDTVGIVSFLNPPDFAAGASAGLNPGHRGTIPLSGDKAGKTNVILKDKAGKEVDRVEVSVVEAREVKVRFYNLVDNKNHQGVRLPDSDVAFQIPALRQLTDFVNRIVAWQCGVTLTQTGTGVLRNLSFAQDFGNSIDINTLNVFSTGDRDDNAEFHVAFAWKIAGSHTNGVTKSNVCLLDASLAGQKREMTLAHEFVHFLSGSGIIKNNDHDSNESDLLYKTAPHGIMLRKDRLLTIRR